MKKRIDYQKLTQQTMAVLGHISEEIEKIMQFELPEEIVEELELVQELTTSGTIEYTRELLNNPYKEIYNSQIVTLTDIKESLKKVLFISGKEVKRIIALPYEERMTICEEMDIPFLSDEFEGLSDELRHKLRHLLSKVRQMESSSYKYFLPGKEKLADFEEDLKKKKIKP